MFHSIALIPTDTNSNNGSQNPTNPNPPNELQPRLLSLVLFPCFNFIQFLCSILLPIRGLARHSMRLFIPTI